MSRLTVGERVAWHRRRRGLSQEALAGLVGRTADWLSKAENGRLELDRLSVLTALAEVLEITVGDLIADQSLVGPSSGGNREVAPLRSALMDYRRITPFGPPADKPDIALPGLRRDIGRLWDAYQNSHFGYVAARLPGVLARAQAAADSNDQNDRRRALRLLALTHQLAGVQLTKFGEVELAWIAADRGLHAARHTGDPVIMGSLLRSVVHALLSTGRHREAVTLTDQAAGYLEPALSNPTPELLSVYGTLLLAGSMAAARATDPGTTRGYLSAANDAARRLGYDGNHLWTAFGPTNVGIHRVATATELGNLQVAVDLGERLDTSALPTERRVRHELEVARALSGWNRQDEALALVLNAERAAPEQVRHLWLSRQLTLTWVRGRRGKPSATLVALAHRLRVLD